MVSIVTCQCDVDAIDENMREASMPIYIILYSAMMMQAKPTKDT